MGKRKKTSTYEYNHTPTTLLVASFGGACAFVTVENTIADILGLWGYQVNKLLAWQVNMGALCVGIVTFTFFLFILEVIETRSKIIAWRTSVPWLPLVGLTAIATLVHIPFYVVVLISAICVVWAYRRTCSVRRLHRLP
jgi:hypothetical protein